MAETLRNRRVMIPSAIRKAPPAMAGINYPIPPIAPDQRIRKKMPPYAFVIGLQGDHHIFLFCRLKEERPENCRDNAPRSNFFCERLSVTKILRFMRPILQGCKFRYPKTTAPAISLRRLLLTRLSNKALNFELWCNQSSLSKPFVAVPANFSVSK